MKTLLVSLCAIFLASTAIAGAQDKDRDKDQKKAHNHHIILRPVNDTVAKGQAKMRPFYHPKKRYSDSEWAARIKAAQERRHHKHHKPTPWWKAKPKHKTAWWKARHKKHVVIDRERHDNGKHLGWQKGRHNPHRR